MNSNLPTHTPAEVLTIDPESLLIANSYLETQNPDQISIDLDVSKDFVISTLAKREVKAYIDGVFLSLGFNNKFKMRRAIDALIQKKFQEMEESGTGSSKDISELLALSHKFTMDEYDKMIKLETLRNNNIKNQLNVQINDNAGSNYSSLIEKLLNGQ